MPTLQFATRVPATPAQVFDLLCDFANYSDWLPRSKVFGKTTDIAPYPVCVGTTYTDRGPRGTLYGTVTECEPGRHLRFEQPMKLALGPLKGSIGIDARYSLEADGAWTNVVRDVILKFAGIVVPLGPMLMPQFREENARILDCLKKHFES